MKNKEISKALSVLLRKPVPTYDIQLTKCTPSMKITGDWLVLSSGYFEKFYTQMDAMDLGILDYMEKYHPYAVELILHISPNPELSMELLWGAYQEYPYCEELDKVASTNNLKILKEKWETKKKKLNL